MKPTRAQFLLAIFPALFLALFLFYPVLQLLPKLQAQNFIALANNYYLGRLFWTMAQASLTVLLACVFGVASALVFSRMRFFAKSFLESLLGLPLVMPVVVVALGFMGMFGPQSFIGIELPAWLLVLLANLFYNHAIVFKIVLAALRNQSFETEQVARLDGANEWQVFRLITLPSIAPAIFSSASLVFLYCFTAFGVPLILGRGQFNTLEVEVYLLVSQRLQLGIAGALALLQFVVAGIGCVLYVKTQTKPEQLEVASNNQKEISVLKATAPLRLMLVLTVLALLMTLAPLLALPLRAFFSATGFTLQNVLLAFASSDGVFSVSALDATLNSLKFSGVGLILALVLAVLFSLAARDWPSLDVFTLAPLCVSSIMLAVAYIVAYPSLRATPTLLVIAYALIAYPLIVRSLLPALRNLPTALSDAAQSDGANELQIWWRITLPLVGAPLAAGAALAFASLIGDFATTLLLMRPEWTTLSALIYERLGKPGRLGEASVLAMLLLLLTGIAYACIEKIAKKLSV